MTNYIGFEDDTSSGFTSQENIDANPALYTNFKKVFEIESDSWEEASHAWHQFQHGGSYNPVCPADCGYENPDCPGTLLSSSDCALCRGKGWVTMEVWRLNKPREG
jgi:hypothetical protein